MKTINVLFFLAMAMPALMVTAQKADSVIVIYDNQKTVIPVPAFGNQTTIKMADSIQIIEIGVSKRRAGDNLPNSRQPGYQLVSGNTSSTSGKAGKQVKWLSQIEAGYIKGYTDMNIRAISTYRAQDGVLNNEVYNYEMSDINGFQLRVLLREGVTMLNEKISFNSGLKFGYRRSFNNAYSNYTKYDSTGSIISNVSQIYDIRANSFLLTYEAGFAYHFQTFKLSSKIFIGNSFNYSLVASKDINSKERYSSRITSNTSILHPYIGTEIGKFGLLISMDWNITDQSLLNNYGYPFDRTHTLTTALTYRLF
ncbi:MAG: hypothetical protein RBS33_15065 [Lentimicrobium sp.]|jgi:hypothetical protein|nr:hypothetical protein [Lentimicrobium sp.]